MFTDHAASVHSSQRLSQRSSYAASEINVITNPGAGTLPEDNCCTSGTVHPERIPLSQISSQYPKQQYQRILPLPATYENLRRPGNSKLPQTPSDGKRTRRRRLLPPINTATYTKKVAEFSRNSPPGILPVGYPVFASEDNLTNTEELSPLKILPDPDDFPVIPLRQSPASALPPFIPIGMYVVR